MRFLIVDDHPIVRVGARHMIERAWPPATVLEAETLQQALALLAEAPVQVIVLDLALPDATGIEAPSRLLAAAPGTPLLVLSLHADPALASRLMQMGVAAYLPKARAADELVTAVEHLLAGKRYITPELAEHLVNQLGQAGEALAAPHERLSQQEYRVMQMIAAGHSPAQMARTLQVSVKTVATYRARIFSKSGWTNNTELTKYCLQNGLTDPT